MFQIGQQVRLQKGVIKSRGRPAIATVKAVEGSYVILDSAIYGSDKWLTSQMQAYGEQPTAITPNKGHKKPKKQVPRKKTGYTLGMFKEHPMHKTIKNKIKIATDVSNNYSERADAVSFLLGAGREYLRVKPNDKLSLFLVEKATELRSTI